MVTAEVTERQAHRQRDKAYAHREPNEVDAVTLRNPRIKLTLRKADEKLGELRTAEGTLLPANTRAELRRDMTRLRVVREQLKEIEQQRLRKLEAAAPAKKGPHAMVGLIARVIGIGMETATCWSTGARTYSTFRKF